MMLSWPFYAWMPEAWGYENHWLENVQMLLLLLCFMLCLATGKDKPFYRTLALLVVVIALREVNCGRTLFFPVPGEVNRYYSWSQIPYGWVVRWAYKIFIAGVALRFILVRGFQTCYCLLKEWRLPVWNAGVGVVAVVVTLLAEKQWGEARLEELAELVVYATLASTLFLYGWARLPRAAAPKVSG